MTKEQEAIEMLEDIKNNTWTTKYIMSSDSAKAEIVLNMLKERDREIVCLKQAGEATEETYKRELEKKDKEIGLLLDKLNENYTDVFRNNEVKGIIEIYEKIKNTSNLSGIKLRKECIKQYFERKAEQC